MKNIMLFISLFTALFIFSCEDDDDSRVKPSSNSSTFECIEFTVNKETASFSAPCRETTDSLSWDFGDGNTSNEPSPAHTYSDTGSYQVTLNY